ncbi:MAG TPA: hypothetical protein DEO93_09405, partial [Stenotrophomonas sp.]|nr:hypothetical protein [Stenotrophomonas sp.]
CSVGPGALGASSRSWSVLDADAGIRDTRTGAGCSRFAWLLIPVSGMARVGPAAASRGLRRASAVVRATRVERGLA